MVIYKEQNSKEFSIFKANMILNKDFYTLCSILKDIINDKYWRFYLKQQDLLLKIEDNLEIYD